MVLAGRTESPPPVNLPLAPDLRAIIPVFSELIFPHFPCEYIETAKALIDLSAGDIFSFKEYYIFFPFHRILVKMIHFFSERTIEKTNGS